MRVARLRDNFKRTTHGRLHLEGLRAVCNRDGGKDGQLGRGGERVGIKNTPWDEEWNPVTLPVDPPPWLLVVLS